jgi:hypothetical protein
VIAFWLEAINMAYGGVATYVFNPLSTGRFNFLRIDGLSLDDFIAGPTNIANADTGQLTSAIPGPNQNGLPAGFGRGRGNWRPLDADLMRDSFKLLLPDTPNGFVVPGEMFFSPQIINGDLILTHRNAIANGTGPQFLRIEIQYMHTLIA